MSHRSWNEDTIAGWVIYGVLGFFVLGFGYFMGTSVERQKYLEDERANAAIPFVCPEVEVKETCEEYPCKYCTPIMCDAPPTCSERRAGEWLMMDELQANRREIEAINLYNEGAFDMLQYIEAFQMIEQWSEGPWNPMMSPDFGLMGQDTAMFGWHNASENWGACCEELLEALDDDPFALEAPEGYPDYCM